MSMELVFLQGGHGRTVHNGGGLGRWLVMLGEIGGRRRDRTRVSSFGGWGRCFLIHPPTHPHTLPHAIIIIRSSDHPLMVIIRASCWTFATSGAGDTVASQAGRQADRQAGRQVSRQGKKY